MFYTCNEYGIKTVIYKYPIFHQYILKYWYTAQREPIYIKDIRGQYLWYNKYINNNNDTILNMYMSNK